MFKILSVVLMTIYLFISFKTDALALRVTNPDYYPSQSQIPPYYTDAGPCPSSCGALASTCWNSEAIGVTNCGTACNDPDQESQPWTKYEYSQSTCYYDPNLSLALGDTVCTPIYVMSDRTCSTGDKYNSANPPVLNAGFCSCAVGGAYKTCCSGSTPVNATSFAVDPYDPLEGGCGNSTLVYCGGAGQPACGVDACRTLATPTPTPTATPTPTPPGACPNSQQPPSGPASGWGGPCSPEGTTRNVNSCSSNGGGWCSVTGCFRYTNGALCWYNSGQCYNDPNACRDVNPINQGCTDEQGNRYSVGAIRTVCGQPNSCVVQ